MKEDVWKNWAIGILVIVVVVMLFYKPGILLSSPVGDEEDTEPSESCDVENQVTLDSFADAGIDTNENSGRLSANQITACVESLRCSKPPISTNRRLEIYGIVWPAYNEGEGLSMEDRCNNARKACNNKGAACDWCVDAIGCPVP